MSRIYSSSRLALELNPACAIPRDFYHGLLGARHQSGAFEIEAHPHFAQPGLAQRVS